jgi:hypothetical protein
MRYSVIWKPEAEHLLAELWMNSPDRGSITAAAREIEQRLQAAPENEGESRPDDRRILFAPPLAVLFRVYPARRLVHVLGVWMFRKKPRST